jgi:branched-chain amino acid transport system ATP-binding protein
MLKIVDIMAGYGKKMVLNGVSLSVEEGQIVTLIGANGAGKSTTLKTIMRLISISKGSVEFEGREINSLTPPEVVNLKVVMVPEGRKIFSTLTVTENLIMGAFTRRGKRNSLLSDTEEMFRIFPALKGRGKQLGGTLSGGEQQMLAIARALMAKPRLILLDEPSMGLAPLLVEMVFRKVKEINERGATILLVEQNATMALSTAHIGYIMESGQITLQGTCTELKGNKKVVDTYLGVT